LPLPGTPDPATLNYRLALAGLKLGSPLLIRIFKAESALEIWMEKDGTYVPFASYPICYWSGTLGPKLREGDRQAPEGFYTITIHQLHDGRRWTRSLEVGFPNVYDEANERSGSNILIHGGCNSVGCFFFNDTATTEIYTLVSEALSTGVVWVPVHVFPFKMTDANFAARAADKWSGFWITLKQGYDSFERTRLPPRVSVCEKAYSIEDRVPGAGSEAGPVAFCEPPGAVPQIIPLQPSQQAAHTAGAIPAILLSASAVRVVDRPNKNRIEAGIARAAPPGIDPDF
jgi:murein L,D-transpeptidase YafK